MVEVPNYLTYRKSTPPRSRPCRSSSSRLVKQGSVSPHWPAAEADSLGALRLYLREEAARGWGHLPGLKPSYPKCAQTHSYIHTAATRWHTMYIQRDIYLAPRVHIHRGTLHAFRDTHLTDPHPRKHTRGYLVLPMYPDTHPGAHPVYVQSPHANPPRI